MPILTAIYVPIINRCCHEFKKTSHMAMESKKAYGFLFQISTKTNKKELAIKPLLFVYSLIKASNSY